MDALLLTLRLALAAVFLVAALTKLADRAGTRRAIEEFGVPGRYARPGAVALPVAELAVAGCALVPGAARAGAVLALALLAAFSAAIATNLARGRTPDCHCFGQLRSEPIGWRTLARNGCFVAIALLILVLGWGDPGPSAVSWIADLDGTGVLALVLGIAALAASVVGSWVATHLLRQHGRLMLRIERLEAALGGAGVGFGDEAFAIGARGLPVGDPAPGFELTAMDGGTAGLASLLAAGRPLLLVFTDSGCGPCQALLPEVARWQDEHRDELTIAVLASGDRDASRATAGEHGLANVLDDPERTVVEAYQASATPAAVLVAPDATIAGPLAEGDDPIRQLLALGLDRELEAAPGLAVGEPAPALVLADLDGERVPLAERLATRGQTLLVFWNPTCGFCRDMHADLLEYERDAGNGLSPLLVLSAGGADEVREEGFSSVLLDPDFSAASAFGASGTPMAVIVDAEGRIASPLAAGAPAVLALAGPAVS